MEDILQELGEANITSKDKIKKTKTKRGKNKSQNKMEGASTPNDISNDIKTVPILVESTHEKSKQIGRYISSRNFEI